MIIRETIAEIAALKNWDYKTLAERTGIPRATVHRYLNGKLDLTGGRIERLMAALGLRIAPERKKRAKKAVEPLFLEPVPGAKPLFPYPGSKWLSLPQIIPQMPAHHHYVSVFGGSASDIIRKTPSKLETFNDLNDHIHTVFSLLQDEEKLAALKKKLLATPAQCHSIFGDAISGLKSKNPVERAWAFLVVSYQGWCVVDPSQVYHGQWRFVKYPLTTPKRWLALPETLQAVAARFRSVQITQWDWPKLLRNTDSTRTLFFIDPPYSGSDNFDLSMPKVKHELLLRRVNRLKGSVILCGHRNRPYDRLLAAWRRQTVGQTKSGKAECVWMNFDEQGCRLK